MNVQESGSTDWYILYRAARTFLLTAQILSHSIMLTDLDEPWATMNCFSPSTVIPRLSTPRTVGNRGSSLNTRTQELDKDSIPAGF